MNPLRRSLFAGVCRVILPMTKSNGESTAPVAAAAGRARARDGALGPTLGETTVSWIDSATDNDRLRDVMWDNKGRGPVSAGVGRARAGTWEGEGRRRGSSLMKGWTLL